MTSLTFFYFCIFYVQYKYVAKKHCSSTIPPEFFHDLNNWALNGMSKAFLKDSFELVALFHMVCKLYVYVLVALYLMVHIFLVFNVKW